MVYFFFSFLQDLEQRPAKIRTVASPSSPESNAKNTPLSEVKSPSPTQASIKEAQLPSSQESKHNPLGSPYCSQSSSVVTLSDGCSPPSSSAFSLSPNPSNDEGSRNCWSVTKGNETPHGPKSGAKMR